MAYKTPANPMTKTPALLAIALVSTAWAADDAHELPTSAQAIVDKAARTIAANRARYDAANNAPLADAEKALKAKQAELAKAGKLEDALAIQKFLEVFRTEVVASVDDRANANGDAPETVKVSRKLLVGKWKRNDGAVFEFVRTGALLCWWNAAHHDAGMAHEASGTWTCDGRSAGFDLAGRRFAIESGIEAELSLKDLTGGGVPYTMAKVATDETPPNSD